MFLLVLEDCFNGASRIIVVAQHSELVPQVLEDHPFHGHGGQQDCARTAQPRGDAQRIATRRTQGLAAAARQATAFENVMKYRPVLLLMRPEGPQFLHEVACGQTGHEDLAGINADGSLLSRMIYLHCPVRKLRIRMH
jgi:hypothetical protein